MPQITPQQAASLKRILKTYGTNNYGAGSGIGATPTAFSPKAPAQSKQDRGVIPSIARTFRQGANIAGEAAGAAVNYAKQIPSYFYHDVEPFLRGVARTVTGDLSHDLGNIDKQYNQIQQQQRDVMNDYKAGRISKSNYIKRMDDFAKSYQDFSKQAQAVANKTDRGNVVQSAFMTGADILSVGAAKGTEAGARPAIEMGIKDAFQFGAKEGITNLLDRSALKLEEVATKIPAVKDLLARNALKFANTEVAQMAGENLSRYILREGKNLAFGLLVKRPIVYETNIGGGEQIYNQILAGHYDQALKNSAWLGTQMLKGGPLGAFYTGGKWIKGKLGKLAYGRGSFIDEVSKRIGDGNSNQIVKFMQRIEREAPQESKNIEKTFRILQETNMRSADENLQVAVDNLLNHYVQHGIDLNSLTPEQLYKDMNNWVKADQLAQKTLRQGLVKNVISDDAGKYVVVRWDTSTKKALADAISQTDGSIEQMSQALYNLADKPGVGWGNNRILMNKLESILNKSQSAEEAASAIKKITTASTLIDGVPKKVAQELDQLGYSIAAPAGGRKTPIISELDETRKLVTGAVKNSTDVFDPATAPQPQLASMAGAIDKIGLSPKASNEVANRVLGESLVANLDELNLGKTLGLKNSQGADLVNGGRAILSKLQTYMETRSPILKLGRSAAVTDLRQLRIGEIKEALGLSHNEAKLVSKAILDAYTKIPMEFRGMGDKALDYWYKVNPLQKYYSRIQAAARYTYNPFFRAQERVETKLLSHAQANNLIWQKSRSELNDAAKVLEDSGIFQFSGIGEAAQEIGTGQFARKGSARISANITQGQKRDLAGLALDIAEKRGISLQQLANNHSNEIDDALRVVVQYGRRGVLSSPLARTLSMVFFPLRYNLKVSKLAADVLVKQPPTVQLAVIHSLFKMDEYLQSDEGIRWQAEHADALKALNWILPTNSIAYTLNLLGFNTPLSPSEGKDKFSVGELGQLGGLPFGILAQLLDKNHVIQLNKPYVDPKTGNTFPDYVPDTMKAKAAQGVVDLLGSMFTYPGRTLGLPGKTEMLRKVVDQFINTNGKDFDKDLQEDRLTPLQKQWIKVLKGDTSKETLDQLYNSPAPGGFNWYTLPPVRLEVPTPVKQLSKAEVKAMKGSGGRRGKKKALPIPSQ